jgi:peroxiredoxin
MRGRPLVAALVTFGLAVLGVGHVAGAAESAPTQAAPAPGWLGIAMDAGAPDGVRVKHVVRGSPADRAGLRSGDRIVRVDTSSVVTATQVTRAVSARSAGDRVQVTYARAGGETTVTVTLDARPSADQIVRMDKVGTFAPAWVGTSTHSGGPASLASLRGRVVVLDFWAIWCGPCRMVAPKLNALQGKYGAQGLSVVGITTDDLEQAAAFRERTQMKYPVVSDPNGDTTSVYGVSGLPTLFVIDKRGVVRDVAVGYDPARDAAIETLVQALLAENVTSK